MSDQNLTDGLTQLGSHVAIPDSPEKAELERIPNPKPNMPYNVRFTMPEFTSLCPVTGAPDFAHLVIDYVPADYLVESKSLKLYLNSFRNHNGFHEDCTLEIAHKIIKRIIPKWFRIGGYWYPRGGMPIDVFYQSGEPPKGIWIPDQGVAPYRGRGQTMKDIMIALFITVLFLIPSKAIADNVHECPSFNAVYKPHESYKPKAYDLELTFSPPLPKDPVTSREFYFHITSYKKGTDQKISMLQLASTCTLGVSVCRANAYWGQFADMEHFSNDVQSKMSFDYKFLSENFSDKDNGDAPYAVIFMHTASEFLRRMPDQSDWHHYTKFYTDKKTFPDFTGYDVWIFDHCSE